MWSSDLAIENAFYQSLPSRKPSRSKVIAELAGDDWKLSLNLDVRAGLDQATRLCLNAARRILARDCDCDGLSASGAHALQAGNRKFLPFREQIFVTGRESHDKSSHPVLIERRLDFIDKLPAASHRSSMPMGLMAVMG